MEHAHAVLMTYQRLTDSTAEAIEDVRKIELRCVCAGHAEKDHGYAARVREAAMHLESRHEEVL